MSEFKSILEAYSKAVLKETFGTDDVTGETSGHPTPENNNTELGGNAVSFSNLPASDVKSAIKELIRYKRPSYEIEDEVIDSISDEELRAIQNFLDQKINHAKISKIASESVDTSHYISGI